MPSIPVPLFIRVCTLLADLSNFAGGTCEIVPKKSPDLMAVKLNQYHYYRLVTTGL